MKEESLFRQTFLKPADPWYWLTEVVTYPRARDVKGKRCIYRVNKKEDIQRGFKQRIDQYGQCWEQRLKRRKDGSFKWYLTRKLNTEHAKAPKKWVFYCYHSFRFIQFDIDRHSITADPKDQVKAVQALGKHLCADIVWTFSPGDIYDGQHIQGLYAWMKLSRAYSVENLEIILNRFQQQFIITSEHCADKRLRPIRIPGQCYMQVVINPFTMECIEPIKSTHTLTDFLPRWFAAKPVNNQRLMACLSRKEKRLTEEKKVVASVATSLCTKSIGAATPLEDHGDTFKLVQKACSDTLIAFGSTTPFDQLCTHAEHAVQTAIKRESDTVASGRLATAVATQMTYFVKTFKPTKGSRGSRKSDLEVYDAVKDITEAELRGVIRTLKGSERVEAFLVQFLIAVKTCKGRIANRPTSSPGKGVTMVEMAGGRRAYDRLKPDLAPFIAVADTHCLGKCRLWTFTQKVFGEISVIRNQSLTKRNERRMK